MPRALVIGGSVGGLFAASLLRTIGWDVAVFEKSTGDLSGRGAGLGLSRELFEVMRRAGAEIDPSIGVACPSLLRLDRSGAVLTRIERGWTSGIWSRVYRALRETVPEGIVFTGRTFERVTQDDSGVRAHFADGGTEAGDLLVACDGVYSSVRGQYLPDVAPRYAGYVAWRCLIEERLMPPDAHALLSRAMTYVFPPGEMSLSMPSPGRGDDVRPGHRGYYIIWYRPAAPENLRDLMTDAAGHNHGFTIPPPEIRKDVVAAMRKEADALLPPMLAEVVAHSKLPLLQAITDLEVPRMTFGRVALLGDAAFVARPHAAAGITKAAMDADTLADELAAHPGDVCAALSRYDTKRLAFGQSLVDYARRLGTAALAPDAVRDPEQVMRDYGAPNHVHDVEHTPAFGH